jgi:hypothetical protein
MARVKTERERAGRLFLRPTPGGAMNGSAMHRLKNQRWATYPSKSLPARKVEQAVWQKVRERGFLREQ